MPAVTDPPCQKHGSWAPQQAQLVKTPSSQPLPPLIVLQGNPSIKHYLHAHSEGLSPRSSRGGARAVLPAAPAPAPAQLPHMHTAARFHQTRPGNQARRPDQQTCTTMYITMPACSITITFFFFKPILISKWRKALPASLENESMQSIALLSSSSFPPDLAPQVSAWPADTTSFAGLKPSRSRRLPAHEHQPPRSQQQPVMGTEMQQRAHACAGPGRKALKRE